MIIKFNPAGRVVMVFGRRKESADEEAEPLGARQSAAAARGRPVPPADRRRVGLGRQHLHQRRLRQLARRQVRQERRLGEVAGASRAAGPGQFNTPHSDRDRPQRQHLCRRPRATAASRCSTPTASSSRVHDRRAAGSGARARSIGNTPTGERACRHDESARRNAICITPGAEPGAVRRRTPFPGAIFKVSLDGKVLGVIGKSGQAAEAVLRRPRARVPVGERDLRRRDLELARAEADSEALTRPERTRTDF